MGRRSASKVRTSTPPVQVRTSDVTRANPATNPPSAPPSVQLPSSTPEKLRYFGSLGVIGALFVFGMVYMFAIDAYFQPERRDDLAMQADFKLEKEKVEGLNLDSPGGASNAGGAGPGPIVSESEHKKWLDEKKRDFGDAVRRKIPDKVDAITKEIAQYYDRHRDGMDRKDLGLFREIIDEGHGAVASIAWAPIQPRVKDFMAAPNVGGYGEVITEIDRYLQRFGDAVYDADPNVLEAKRDLGRLIHDLYLDFVLPECERLVGQESWQDSADEIERRLPRDLRRRWASLFEKVYELKQLGRDPIREANAYEEYCRDNALPWVKVWEQAKKLQNGEPPPVGVEAWTVLKSLAPLFGGDAMKAFQTLFDQVNKNAFHDEILDVESAKLGQLGDAIEARHTAYVMLLPFEDAADFMMTFEILDLGQYRGVYAGRLLPDFNTVTQEETWDKDTMERMAFPAEIMREEFGYHPVTVTMKVRGTQLTARLASGDGKSRDLTHQYPQADRRPVVIMVGGYGKAKLRNLRFKALPERD